MRSSLVLATILAIPPCLLQAESVPRKTGNMTIISYRTPLMKGQKPQPLDPMLRDPEKLKRFGFSSIEDYVTLDVIEPQKGKFNFEPHIANAKACRQHGFKYAIYPWVHFYPDWVETEPGFTRYTNLEDGSTCRQPSGWAPFTTKLMDHFYRVIAKHIGAYVDAVYVTDCAEYGELGYPNSYTQWLRPDENAKVAWWCGDKYARADFRTRMLEKHESLEKLNAAWGTDFKDKREITYPPIELLKSNPDPRKLAPQQRRWILDFVYWYQDSSARRVKEYLRIAQKHFPNAEFAVKLGHADERAIMGHSYSSACRILGGLPRLVAIRSTHASVSYFHVKRVATPARFPGGFGFLTEPPGKVAPERMAERIFTDACAGVSAYFDYPENPPAAGDAFHSNIGLLGTVQAQPAVALFFPEADHYLRIDKTYPEGLLACANAIRDVADFDVVDERMTGANVLQHYGILIIVGTPLIEEATLEHLRHWLAGDPQRTIIQIVDPATADSSIAFGCVNGELKTVDPDPSSRHAVRRIRARPDSDEVVQAIQQAHRGMEYQDMPSVFKDLISKRDQVWIGVFRDYPDVIGDRFILAFNRSDEERRVNGKILKGKHIMKIRW